MSIFKKILIALVVLLIALAVAAFFIIRGDPADMTVDAVTGLAIKIAFAAGLSAIVTPFAVHRALTAPVRNFQ